MVKDAPKCTVTCEYGLEKKTSKNWSKKAATDQNNGLI